jgi:hypothetical protein
MAAVVEAVAEVAGPTTVAVEYAAGAGVAAAVTGAGVGTAATAGRIDVAKSAAELSPPKEYALEVAGVAVATVAGVAVTGAGTAATAAGYAATDGVAATALWLLMLTAAGGGTGAAAGFVKSGGSMEKTEEATSMSGTSECDVFHSCRYGRYTKPFMSTWRWFCLMIISAATTRR